MELSFFLGVLQGGLHRDIGGLREAAWTSGVTPEIFENPDRRMRRYPNGYIHRRGKLLGGSP